MFTIDEAVEVLEKNDAKEIADDQKRLAADEIASDEFAQSYKEVITELRHRDKDAVLAVMKKTTEWWRRGWMRVVVETKRNIKWF